MSLALATVEASEFDDLYTHITAHFLPYRNLHMREVCQRSGRRQLRYLHAMFAVRSARPEIEGVISGPEVFWHYKLVRLDSQTQLNVLDERGPDRELDRIERRFTREIMARVSLERETQTHYPKRTPGEFYLRRQRPGSAASHRHCALAVASGTLAPEFVSKLAAWDLELLRP